MKSLERASSMKHQSWLLGYFKVDLIIDKANLISLLSTTDNNEIYECTRLIKRGIHLWFNFQKDDININSQEGDRILTWLKNLTHGIKTSKPIWNHCIESASLKTNFATNLSPEQKRSLFLLDNNEVIPNIKKKGAILIGSVGQEAEMLLSLILEDKEIATSKISTWVDYCPKLPLTDIIISDNHFFKDSYVYKQNRDDLIRGMTQVVQQSPVNCVIIFKKGEVSMDLNLEEEIENIKKSIKKITGSSKSSVTFIGTYSTHDRNAITNYYRLKNGSCFHLKSNGLKSDVTTEIKTHANVSNEKRTNELLAVYQSIIDENKGKNIYGDKKSNFLLFSD